MSLLLAYFPQLLHGLMLTMIVALSALIVGLMLAFIFAIAEKSQYAWVRVSVKFFCYIIKGIPELIVLFIIYFGTLAVLKLWWGHYVNVPTMLAGIISLALIFSAYGSQVMTGAMAAVSQGQTDSAKSLGLSQLSMYVTILWPQILYHALPGLNNLWLCLLKDTALLSLIGFADLMNVGELAATGTGKPFSFYLLVTVMYLMITYWSQWVIAKINKQFKWVSNDV